MIRTIVERAWEKGKAQRPTAWLPNGCGPAATGSVDFVPDTLFGVEFGHDCCDLHDLAYHQGGFLGLFWRKPKADFELVRCMARKLWRAGRQNANFRSKTQGYIQMAAAGPVAGIYGLAVTLFGWSPFTWRWKERPVPTHEQLVALKKAIRPDPARSGRVFITGV